MESFHRQQPQISQLVCDNSDFLRALARTKSCRRKRKLLKHATTSQLLSISEICLNILCSRFRLTTRQQKRLLPYADFVRGLARKRTEKSARHFLVQKGSGIGGLFAAILTPILIDLAKSAFSSKTNSE